MGDDTGVVLLYKTKRALVPPRPAQPSGRMTHRTRAGVAENSTLRGGDQPRRAPLRKGWRGAAGTRRMTLPCQPRRVRSTYVSTTPPRPGHMGLGVGMNTGIQFRHVAASSLALYACLYRSRLHTRIMETLRQDPQMLPRAAS